MTFPRIPSVVDKQPDSLITSLVSCIISKTTLLTPNHTQPIMAHGNSLVALQLFSTCDVADALSKLGHPDGGFLSGLTLWSPRRQEGETKVVGPAYTVKYVRHTDVTPPKRDHYIDYIPPGSVVFISSPPGIVNSVYGGLMSARAKASGAAGTIVDGRIRDLQEHRALNYPVFARDVGTTAFYQVARVEEVSQPKDLNLAYMAFNVSPVVQTDVPVRLQSTEQEMTIHPGDILIGDLNGVVCIPRGLLEKVLTILPDQTEADGRIRQDLEAGEKFATASKKHRAAIRDKCT